MFSPSVHSLSGRSFELAVGHLVSISLGPSPTPVPAAPAPTPTPAAPVSVSVPIPVSIAVAVRARVTFPCLFIQTEAKSFCYNARETELNWAEPGPVHSYPCLVHNYVHQHPLHPLLGTSFHDSLLFLIRLRLLLLLLCCAVHAGDQSSGQLIILFALYTHLFSLNAPKSSLNGWWQWQWVILATLDRAGPEILLGRARSGNGSLAVIMALAGPGINLPPKKSTFGAHFAGPNRKQKQESRGRFAPHTRTRNGPY